MKVLKEKDTLITKCPNCNAALEVEKDDFKLLNEGEIGFSLCYICPICNKTTIVKIKDMPFPLFNELFQKYEEEMIYRLKSCYEETIENCNKLSRKLKEDN